VDPAFEQEIREAYAAFAAGDVDRAMSKFFAPDAAYVNPEYATESSDYGPDALRRGLLTLHEHFEYESAEVEEIQEGPDGLFVLVRLKATGRGSGVPVNATFAHVFRRRDGLVTGYEWYASRDEGIAAAGLSSS
jgi:ketosteroid isomerase-like protein